MMSAAVRWIRSGRGLPTFALATVVVMVLVILWGAVVRITSSGGGCGNHWPLCNGVYFPQHPRMATLIEFTHRATTGVCSTLALLVLAWTFLVPSTSRIARTAAVVSVVFLFIEAFLGRALVIHGYVERNTSDARSIMQCVHFTNTMALLAAFTLTWWWLRPLVLPVAPPHEDGKTYPALSALSLLLAVLVGATGSVAALADTLFPSPNLTAALLQDFAAGAPLIVRMRWIHPTATVLMTLILGYLCVVRRTGLAKTVFALLGSQIVAGVLDVLLLAPSWMQIVHLLGADLCWIVSVLFLLGELPHWMRSSNVRETEKRPSFGPVALPQPVATTSR